MPQMTPYKNAFGAPFDAPDPADAMAEFLSGQPNMGAPSPSMGANDPLALQKLRGDAMAEHESSIANLAGMRDTGPVKDFSGATYNSNTRQAAPEFQRQNVLESFLKGDEASDPFTGKQAMHDDPYVGADVMAREKLGKDAAFAESDPALKAKQAHDEAFKIKLAEANNPPPIPKGMTTKDMFGPVGPQAAVNPNETEEARTARVLKGQPPGAVAFVQALLDYKQKPPSAGSSWGAAEPYVAMAQQIDPTWNAGEYEQRFKGISNYRTGKEAQSLVSGDQLLQHLDSTNNAIGPLGNLGDKTGFVGTGINALDNMLRGHSNENLKRYKVPAENSAMELARFMSGGEGSDALRNTYHGWFDPADSQGNQHAGVSSAANLMQGRVHAIEGGFAAALGMDRDSLPQRFKDQLQSPTSRALMERLISQGVAPEQAGAAVAASVTGGGASPAPGGGHGVSVKRLD